MQRCSSVQEPEASADEQRHEESRAAGDEIADGSSGAGVMQRCRGAAVGEQRERESQRNSCSGLRKQRRWIDGLTELL
jgi:hypothetical protein